MTLVERHIGELKAALWRDLPALQARLAALYDTDPAAFLAAGRQAVQDNDNRSLIAMGQALQARGELTAKPFQKIRFAAALLRALLAERRWREALDLLELPSIANPAHYKHWTMKARALAGLGRVKEAHRAVREGLALRPGSEEAIELEAALRTTVKLRRWFDDGGFGWDNLRRLVDAYLSLDLAEEAAFLLKAQLKPFPEVASGEEDQALAVLAAAIDLRDPERTLRDVEAAKAVLGDSERLGALAARCQIALGRPAAALGEDVGHRDIRLQRALALAACGDFEGAIARLGAMSEIWRRDSEVREALAFYVGAEVLQREPLAFGPAAARPRILNLVPFNDELEMLQIRLAEMADWVDLFVIVESTVTFTGIEKPLHFDRAKSQFAAYAHKIRHVVVDGHPAAFSSPWSRDFRQRDLAAPALSGLCAPDDLVLLTDVDEIVDRRALDGFAGDFAGLRMAMFRFFLNYRPSADNLPWRPTGAVLRARLLARFGSSYARFCLARRKGGAVVERAGWHFTSVGDSRRLVAKVNSYAHQERKAHWRDEDRVGRLFADIRAGKLERGWERAEIDESFPRYLREHAESFRDLMI